MIASPFSSMRQVGINRKANAIDFFDTTQQQYNIMADS
jgi:hypothetical protein